MKRIFLFPTLYLLAASVHAQGTNEDWRVRLVLHPTVQITPQFYFASWLIENTRASTPGNFNVFGGLGYRRGVSWIELLAQRQFSQHGARDQTLLDIRTTMRIASISAYLEIAPFFTQRALYQLGWIEYPVARALSLGLETENILKSPKKSTGYGPRISWKGLKLGGMTLVVTESFQFRQNDHNIARTWGILHYNRTG